MQIVRVVAFTLALAAGLAGCNTVQDWTPQVSFDPTAAAYINEHGTAAIRGQAFLKTRGGDVKTAAGFEVVLAPATRYWQDLVYQRWQGAPFVPGFVKVNHLDPAARSYTRRVIADGEGRFSFEGLAPGSYYVLTAVGWEVPAGSYSSSVEGGQLQQLVDVATGEHKEVVVTSTAITS